MVKNKIKVVGAKENNLRNINVEIPHEKFVVISGISGSGKSSLAFNTIYSEAQRRYMETLSAYARQFIGSFDRPDVEHIDGLRPTISIDQKTISRNPRSTVGTLTEVYDYMRVLYARVGVPHCPNCGKRIAAVPPEQIVDFVFATFEDQKIKLLAPMVENRKGEYRKELREWQEEGYNRLRVDGEEVNLDDIAVKLDRYKQHTIEIIVDRIICERKNEEAIHQSINLCLELSEGGKIIIEGEEEERSYSTRLVCEECNIAVDEFQPRDFSFNTAVGGCKKCKGLGTFPQVVPEKLVEDPNKSVLDGAIGTQTKSKTYFTYALSTNSLKQLAEEWGMDLTLPYKDLPDEHKHILMHGTGNRIYAIEGEWESKDGKSKGKWDSKTRWKGFVEYTMQGYYQTNSQSRRRQLEKWMDIVECPVCLGSRLKRDVLAVKLHDKNIAEIVKLDLASALEFFKNMQLTDEQNKIAKPLLKEIKNRLSFLIEVGLHYLTLDRSAATLSGGEAQRTRLATQIGSKLQGVTYILDEPSIGLANRDNERLLNSLKTLRDNGNTVITVEHDEDTLRSADILYDLGPGAGDKGGHLLFAKAPNALDDMDAIQSVTARYLLGKDGIAIPEKRRKGEKFIILYGARHNNLKNIDVKMPLNTFTAITGVSGSGKSSLVADTLYPILVNELHNGARIPGRYKKISGVENIDKVVVIDQSPIGRTPRSCPATYTKVLDHIRDLFARLPEAKVRGFTKTRFSYNTKKGQCKTCGGYGYETIEMSLLPDVEVRCETCQGKRYDDETLKVKYKKHSLSDVLNLTVSAAAKLFKNQPKILQILKTLESVGLDYLKLGQNSTTLSGGEAQRIKLSRELSKRSVKDCLYILDEPTTGLSFEDIKKLLRVLHELVHQGNTVLIIEHNLDVIKQADYIIDLGPEGGAGGGYIVAEGTPEEIVQVEESFTGQSLHKVLKNEQKTISTINGNKTEEQIDLSQWLYLRGAKKHNLKNIEIKLPKNKLITITGPSGSGKTSLAMDTIFAEGQRRFVESLSSYARQFLVKAERGDVEEIIGLTPSIAIDQTNISKNPRSTIATTTEIYDYLRLLYAKIGIIHCPQCNKVLLEQSPIEIADDIIKEYRGRQLTIAAPLANGEPINVKKTLNTVKKAGFNRVVLEGKIHRVESKSSIQKTQNLSVVLDRIKIDETNLTRLNEALETGVKWGNGRIQLFDGEIFVCTCSIYPECIDCGYRAPTDITPRLFSFNHYSGACEKCTGLGYLRELDVNKLIVDDEKSIAEGGIGPYSQNMIENGSPYRRNMLDSVVNKLGFDLYTPLKDLSNEQIQAIFYGFDGEIKFKVERRSSSGSGYEMEQKLEWKGLINRWEEHMKKSSSSWFKSKMQKYYTNHTCPECKGMKLKPGILAIKIGDQSITETASLAIDEFHPFITSLELGKREKKIAENILKELTKRAEYLINVGLSYLTLDRRSATLSNGEAQRINLASQIGSGLVGVTYVLDEPTIGLHPRDIDRLLKTMIELRDAGNNLLVVEHDDRIIRSSDYMLELGPYAGENGGEIVTFGAVSDIFKNGESSLTLDYLKGKKSIPLPTKRRTAENHISISGCKEHNLKNIAASFGKGIITAVTGVSGAGKSTLVIDTVQAALEQKIHEKKNLPGKYTTIEGFEDIKKVIVVDQTPLSSSIRSNPATYMGVFDDIRLFYEALPKAKQLGLKKGHFSFNTKDGQCKECRGLGRKKVELLFLSDVWIQCPVCKGKRYKPNVLSVRYKQKSISDVLDMTVSEASAHFENIDSIRSTLAVLEDVGLDYLQLGQSTNTISGGEAERLKIARELAKRTYGTQVYIMDEPSQGLHFYDIDKLVKILHRLADEGNAVILIDHNMELVKNADHVIDLGPEGGQHGGYVVAEGTPEGVVAQKEGYTWKYLKELLNTIVQY